jgi:hypothetical protein
MKMISHVPVICCILAFAMLGSVSADIFPPQDGGYMGDHIVITSPGKYTLERDIHHSYPVGIVILSSSVIITGNDRTISPSENGKETVGIWIAAYDQQGMPITGITLKDIHIQDETYGIFIEGDNPTPFSWAADSKAQTGSTHQNLLTQMIDIFSVTISACATGIGISDGIGVRISDAELRDNEYGITASGRDLTVKNSIITKNTKTGVLLDGVIGTSLSQNTITANAIGIEARNSSIDTLSETHNTFANQQNFVTDRIDTTSMTETSFVLPLPIISPTIPSSPEIDTPPMTQVPESNPLTMDLHSPSSAPTVLPSVDPSPTPRITPSAIQTPTKVPKQPAFETPKNLITGIHATIIGDTIPDTLASGSRTSVSLVIANTGSVAWKQDDGIGVSAIGDTARYAPEWQNVSITKSGKKNEYTLDFSLLAPGFPGEYTFSFQAGKKRLDMTSTFGRPYTKTVLIT